MNKELIKKYKKEFDHWLDGGKLQYMLAATKRWEVTNKFPEPMDNFTHEYIIIINDEYVEFRKALAEGKTIQCNISTMSNTQWIDCLEPFFNMHTHCYRIKPEPKFKVGNWVVSPDGNIEQIYKLFDMYPSHAQFSEVQEHGTSDINEWSLWKPQQGEWCYMPYDNSLLLSEVSSIKDTIVHFRSGYSAKVKECIPFIGELPTTRKGNR